MLSPILLVIFICVITYTIWWLRFWTRQGVNGPSPLQMILGFTKPFHKNVDNMSKKYGKVYGTFGLGQRILIVNDPELIYEIFVKRFSEFPDRSIFNFGTTTVIDNFVASLPGGDDWRRLRAVISPAYSTGKIKSMTTQMLSISQKLVEKLNKMLEKGDTIEIKKLIELYVMDVIISCNFGINIDLINTPDHPFVLNVQKSFNSNMSMERIFSMIAPKLSSYFGLQFFDENILNYFADFINKITLERKLRNDMSQIDLLGIMLDSSSTQSNDISQANPSKSFITPDELTAQGIQSIFAGFDSTVSAILHVIYYLAKYQSIQQKVYEELKNIKIFNYENLSELKYLNAVIDETLRLKPSLHVSQRISKNDTELAGIKIPAGTWIHIQNYVVNRDPDFWRDPEQFKPERFLENDYNPRAYITFGNGPRNCIGQKFALNKIRICCAAIIQSFVITLDQNDKINYYNGTLVFKPKYLNVLLKRRE